MFFKALLLLTLTLSTVAYSAQWYQIDLQTWSSLEIMSDRLQISKPYPNWDTYGSAGACADVKYIQIIPPTTEMQKAWTAGILAAQAMGKSLWVYGDCKPGPEPWLLKSPPAGAGRIILE